jgi:hypothetical protein
MSHLFILGFQKCGTTALADYFIKNDLALYLINGKKEPNIYMHSKPQEKDFDGRFYLDASVAYITNVNAINNLPEHDTKLIICLRNQFERSWSCFKMYKLWCDSDRSYEYLMTIPTMKHEFASDPITLILDLLKRHFPLKSMPFIKKHLQFEIQMIQSQNFQQRVTYELSFFVRRGEFPFLSILIYSFYTKHLKYLLNKFTSKELTIVDVDKIKRSTELRESFIHRIFNIRDNYPDIPEVFSGNNFSISEEKPNFNDSRFDVIRDIFRDDIVALYLLFTQNNVSDDFVDKPVLEKFLSIS